MQGCIDFENAFFSMVSGNRSRVQRFRVQRLMINRKSELKNLWPDGLLKPYQNVNVTVLIRLKIITIFANFRTVTSK